MSVSVVGWSLAFRIKECGISFVYEEQEEQKGTSSKSEEVEEEQVIIHFNASPFRKEIDSLFSAYQFKSGEYFLSHAEYFVLKEGCTEGVRAVLYENLFQDNVENTGSMDEGEEDDESDDFYANHKYDEVDEEELMTILGWK